MKELKIGDIINDSPTSPSKGKIVELEVRIRTDNQVILLIPVQSVQFEEKGGENK